MKRLSKGTKKTKILPQDCKNQNSSTDFNMYHPARSKVNKNNYSYCKCIILLSVKNMMNSNIRNGMVLLVLA